MSLVIREAVPGDGAILHGMSRELALHHGVPFAAGPEDFESFLTSPQPVGGALIAEWEGAPAGSAVWHRSFSSFKGREMIYLEDIFVQPAFRSRGIGRELLRAVARLALARGAASVGWLMMDWNEEARAFYLAAGAEIEEKFCYCSLSGAALERFGS
jgi:GNAT superfamily N-acetyltransferase